MTLWRSSVGPKFGEVYEPAIMPSRSSSIGGPGPISTRGFDAQRRRRDAGQKLNGEVPRLVTQWFHQAERNAVHRDFGLVGDLLHMARAEADQDLFDLLDGGSEDVAAAVDLVLIAAGWPARAHVAGAIVTRSTRVADGDRPAALYDPAQNPFLKRIRSTAPCSSAARSSGTKIAP